MANIGTTPGLYEDISEDDVLSNKSQQGVNDFFEKAKFESVTREGVLLPLPNGQQVYCPVTSFEESKGKEEKLVVFSLSNHLIKHENVRQIF